MKIGKLSRCALPTLLACSLLLGAPNLCGDPSPSPAPALSLEQATAIAKAELTKRNLADEKCRVRLLEPRERESFYLIELEKCRIPEREELQKNPRLVHEMEGQDFPAYKVSMNGEFKEITRHFEVTKVGYDARPYTPAVSSQLSPAAGINFLQNLAPLSSPFWQKPLDFSLKATDRPQETITPAKASGE